MSAGHFDQPVDALEAGQCIVLAKGLHWAQWGKATFGVGNYVPAACGRVGPAIRWDERDCRRPRGDRQVRRQRHASVDRASCAGACSCFHRRQISPAKAEWIPKVICH